MILLCLRKNDLTVCARVSKAWNTICTPILWRKLSILKSSRLWPFTTEEIRQALINNGKFVRELNLKYYSLLDLKYYSLLDLFVTPGHVPRINVPQSSVPCTNLRRIFIYENWSYDKEEVDAALVALIKHNPLLHDINVYSHFHQHAVRELSDALAPNLHELHIASGLWPCTAKHLLENLPETIWRVILFIYPDKNEGEHDHSTDSEALRPHRHLEFIHISGTFNGYQEYVLLPFLISCSKKLKKMECPDTICYGNANIRSALSNLGVVCLTLNDEEFPRGRHLSDSAIAGVIESNLQLTKIEIPACYNVGPLTTAAVFNIANLESLNVRSCRSLSSKHLHSILCQARNLRHLTFTCEYFCGGEAVVLMVSDIAEPEWSCTSLERFCSTIYVPRPCRSRSRLLQLWRR